ncbi:DUF3857 domain-containing protein [Ulvibacterium sp.]|uniref:DUF3857 domain-containing transglutaminase family protein n=1 Tax=Ulvibacterium sp. TaxID=2665914 RepID=UPI0026169EF4|nr:DUF3857 domain-containing protein [Ulvibacterium sp.]
MRLLLVFTTLFLVYFCSAQERDYQAFLLDKDLVENANAVVRLDEMRIHLEARNKMVYTVRQVVTVLNKLGNRYANPRVFYDGDKKIKHIEAYVYNKMGKEIEHIKKRDFSDISAADGISLYIDDRLLTYSYTPVQYPYTMEFSYEVETSDTGLFPPWYFLSGYLASVERSHYEITYATNDLKPIIKEHNLGGFSIEKEERAGRIVYTGHKLPAVKSEAHSPDYGSLAPKLSVRLTHFHYKGFDGDVDDWNQLGSWVNNSLLKGRTELSEATKNLARNLVKGIEDDLEKAKVIYKYVQNNTRYISVQIGIGGFRPISAIEVDRVKYGDCKGLSNYTKALLEAVNVESYYTVVEAGSRKVDFKEDFADLRQGNHVILAIPYKDRYYWIDCTSQIHPFGFVGDFTDDRKVLVVKPEGGELVSTVAYNNEQNHQLTRAQFNVLENGEISGEVTITTKGIQYDNRFSLEEKSVDNISKHYKDYWGEVNNLNVHGYKFDNDREEILFTEVVEVSAKNYASLSGERVLFAPNAFNKSTYVPQRYRNRKLPLEIQRGFLDEDIFEITIPNGYKVEALPDNVSLETRFGTYTMELDYDSETNALTYKRSFFLKKGTHPKEEYTNYRNFRKKIASADKAQAVIIKADL